ncbi:hypothetical protein C1Y08_14990 [Pseudomonas sp. FW306-02-F02-AA]|uniref:Uncharacterized protein n=1 Tax=Pseudomonas fluorescens TaxID=294 RepID=A0A0N9WDL7_PSEFL|nr:hypothetical protein AO353_07685 [Pseudomonas fluorescens]PMZ02758.1 hypothetical protein C1Y07_18060 [Pseudomonas sp. FW306-02-F02-AB]PMZ09475.1 hypothetical protein C1Y06_13570 [Pseudomonas sp. FW306-02-H06C]PMZ15057.1 hypothetical protein C1Y08_14990 [Pseudomonas sp. FW306-02-F02-AA]PMZ26516.1 hypothetical protein C1Y05_17500 [Pseudomonas sp. FW306-02-F04-BA]PMZ34155.1 hypothetical protein C1X99_12285 [Pseudomonas sp. FW306-02-H06B]PMZ42050.1 hypothetical protein C1Y00_02640 [Pseudomona
MTYSIDRFSTATAYFLIKTLQATLLMAHRGSQTPYPQKRQQTLGATVQTIQYAVENHVQAAYFVGLNSQRRVKPSIWSFINQKLESHDLYGLQRTANILSTEAPTEIGGKS